MKKSLIREMRRQYLLRLLENLGEADVYDKRGNMLLTKDLKVTHKDSGFEYTVYKVKQNPENKKVLIYLRKPDEPRFEPPGEQGLLNDMPGETHSFVPHDASFDSISDDDIFVISQKDFEKEYEVE
jgi:hypothetical protein